MNFIPNADAFALGLAVGVLGLVLLLSLIISYAYDERTLLTVAAYIAVMVGLASLGEQYRMQRGLIQSLQLVFGPAWTAGLLMWLLRNRHFQKSDKAVMSLVGVATIGLLCFQFFQGGARSTPGFGASAQVAVALAWAGLLTVAVVFLAAQSWVLAGPWKWWLVLGHVAGLGVAMLFLTGTSRAGEAYWPVVLMLLVQIPPIYLALVWRSRLLNESRLRSSSANVVDPLTGLATTPVLIERLMRVMSRTHQARVITVRSALYLIQVNNFNGLLKELGPEFNEKLMLEAALRLRRSIGDNDMAARISGGHFAVVAQGLADNDEVAAMATRLMVSGLRIDSPLLPGVELHFRIIMRPLRFARPLALADAVDWLDGLAARFNAWPSSHRTRSILVAEDDAGRLELDGEARH